MKTENSSSIARRDLFRGAATLLGGSALGLLPNLAAAAETKPGLVKPSATQISVGFWDGKRFVSADQLSSGDVTLEHVNLSVTDGNGGGFGAIEANALVPGRKSVQKVPFTLWVAPPSGVKRPRSTVPADLHEGISLNVFTGSAVQVVTLRSDGGAGAKLREGVYVLAAGRVDWSALRLHAEGRLVYAAALGRPVSSPHVTITVERP